MAKISNLTAVAILLLLLARPANAAYTVVAAYSKWNQSTERHKPVHALYLFDLAKNRKVRIDNHDDFAPVWEPNGKRILFCRRASYNEIDICLMDIHTRRTSTIYRINNGNSLDIRRCAWSPNGAMIGLVHRDDNPMRAELVLFAANGTLLKRFQEVNDAAWSPNSRLLYTKSVTGICNVVNLESNQSSPFLTPLHDAYWLDNDRLIGATEESGSHDLFSIVNAQGVVKYSLAADPLEDPVGWLDAYWPEVDFLSWYKWPKKKGFYILNVDHKMSGGMHSYTYKIDVVRRTLSPVGSYRFYSFSQAGNRFLASTRERLGNEPKDGIRHDQLVIVSLTTRRTLSLTSDTVDVQGADWFKGRM